MFLIDCHTHLDQYPDEEISPILQRASDVNVKVIVSAGSNLSSSKRSVTLSIAHTTVYAGVGIHPTELQGPISKITYRDLQNLVSTSERVVCISEIGLDFLPTSPDRTMQYQALRAQIGLARENCLPIISHSRESNSEILRILREEHADEVGGVMHYFQGSKSIANEAINLGFYISFARTLLRFPELQELARDIPLNSIVLETDAAPQPFKKYRYNWTEPRHVKDIAEKLAALKGITVEEVAQTTTTNIKRLLKLTH